MQRETQKAPHFWSKSGKPSRNWINRPIILNHSLSLIRLVDRTAWFRAQAIYWAIWSKIFLPTGVRQVIGRTIPFQRESCLRSSCVREYQAILLVKTKNAMRFNEFRIAFFSLCKCGKSDGSAKRKHLNKLAASAGALTDTLKPRKQVVGAALVSEIMRSENTHQCFFPHWSLTRIHRAMDDIWNDIPTSFWNDSAIHWPLKWSCEAMRQTHTHNLIMLSRGSSFACRKHLSVCFGQTNAVYFFYQISGT